MAQPLRLEKLSQKISCPDCRAERSLLEFRRVLDFGTGFVRFFCPNCRTGLGRLSFGRWNALRRREQGPRPSPPS